MRASGRVAPRGGRRLRDGPHGSQNSALMHGGRGACAARTSVPCGARLGLVVLLEAAPGLPASKRGVLESLCLTDKARERLLTGFIRRIRGNTLSRVYLPSKQRVGGSNPVSRYTPPIYVWQDPDWRSRRLPPCRVHARRRRDRLPPRFVEERVRRRGAGVRPSVAAGVRERAASGAP